MTYQELCEQGYIFKKENSLYKITAPDGKNLGMTSESKEALQWAINHSKKQ